MIPSRVYKILLEVFPMVVLFTIVMGLIRLITALYGKQKINIRKDIKHLIYLVYCFCLFVLVTNSDFESYSNNFIPFKEIFRYNINSKLFIRNVLGNILLFVPVGYLITDMIITKIKKCNIYVTSLICLITSISIEVIQLYIGRSFDIDDIILNFLGGIIGYIAYKVFHIILNKIRQKYNNVLVDILIFLIMIFILLITVYIGYKGGF